MAPNPNYPVVSELWGPQASAAGASVPAGRWVDLIDRTLNQSTARRGKQYELDQPQAGEYAITLGSQDGALDPTNTGGPWGGDILPYQPYARRAQWPPTPNLLTAVQATCGEGLTVGAIPASVGVKSTADATGGQIAAPSGALTAFQGTKTFRFTVNNGQGSGSRIGYTDGVGVAPGKTYTVQLRVRCITDAVSAPVKAHLAFYGSNPASGPVTFNYGSTSTLTGSSTANTWTLITATATAPTTGGVYGMSVGFSTAGTYAATAVIEVDAWQVERGSSASAWSTPGVWYPLFTGFTERWPSQWADGGTYGEVSPTAVDTFALLSQVQLKDVFQEEIDSHSPRFCFPLSDAAGSTTFADNTGSLAPVAAVQSKTGNGNLTAGVSVVSASATGAYTGSTGTVVNFAPPLAGSPSVSPATVLDLRSVGVNGPATTAWTRMLAFRVTGTLPSDSYVLWETRTNSYGDGNLDGHIRLSLASNGWIQLHTNAKGSDYAFSLIPMGNVNLADGNWHLVVFGFDSGNVRYSVDGATTTQAVSGPPTLTNFVDAVGALWSGHTKSATDAFQGDLAFVTEFPSLLSAADMGQLYSTWRSSASGESSDARYRRILRYAGFTGASNIGAGLTVSMGPADLGGTDVMSALNDVVTTENGEHFVAADGTIVFRGRGVRYNTLSPALTFGDGPGELPYEDLQLDFDSTHLANSVTVTQQSTGTNYTANDAASIAAYFTRSMTRSINTTSNPETQDAADYFVSRYKQPLTRVQSIKLHPSANTALWAPLLALELGTRVRVNRRPPGAPLISADCFVEQISWDMDANNEATVTLQCSPIDANPYGEFAPFHSITAQAYAAGTFGVAIVPHGDSTDPLSAQVPAGTQFVIDPGLPTQETITATSIQNGDFTPGGSWTYGVLVTSVPTSQPHAAGAVVTELLPSGVTDPTYLDSAEKFDTVLFAY
jgi:hypothetical protein